MYYHYNYESITEFFGIISHEIKLSSYFVYVKYLYGRTSYD